MSCSVLCYMFMHWLEERRLWVTVIQWQTPAMKKLQLGSNVTVLRLAQKSQSCCIIIREIMTPMIWRKVCNIFYCVWCIVLVLLEQIRYIFVVGLAYQECLLIYTRTDFPWQSVSFVRSESDENGASLKPALSKQILDSDITACHFP